MKLLSKAAWVGALTLLFCLFGSPAQANSRGYGYCQQGAVVPTVSNLPTNVSVQASYPGCTATVYLTGTLTLATIYSDNNNTPLGNPFTASVTTGYWFFYAADGCYDVTISGGGPPALSAPFTYGDVCLGAGGSATNPGSPNLSLQFNNSNSFAGSQFLYDAANSSGNCSIDFAEPQQYTTHAVNPLVGGGNSITNTLCLDASGITQHTSVFMGSGSFAQINSLYFIAGTFVPGTMNPYCVNIASPLPGTAGNASGIQYTCYDTSGNTTYPYCLYGLEGAFCLDGGGNQNFGFIGNSLQLGDPNYQHGTGVITFYDPTVPGSATISAADSSLLLLNGVATVDPAGNLTVTSCTGCGGGSGSPAGSDTQIQYNDMNVFGASANFTWNYGTNKLTITGTESISGQLTSTLTTGTPPFVIASTTNVPNLNASSLSGATFAAPGPIGSGTPSTGAFTTLSASSAVSGTGFSTYLASPPAIGGTVPAAVSMTVGTFTSLACIEGTAPSAVSGKDIVYCDSTAHATYISANGGGFAQVRTGTVGVAFGGTSLTTITLGDLLCGNGTGTPILVPPVMSGYVLTDNGAGACPTFQVGPTGMSSSLDTVTAAMADATIGNGAYQERWNSVQTGSQNAFYLGEASAATGTGNIKLRVSTLGTSTAEPFRFDNNGNGIVMNDVGQVESIGTGGNDFQGSITNFPAACSATFVRAIAATPTCNKVSMTADITGVTPFANGGTNNNAAPVKRVLFQMGGCNAGASAPSLSIPSSGGMGNNCKTDGTHGTVMGILSAAAGSIAYISIPIPHDFASFNSAQAMFTTSDVTNGHTIILKIATACVQPNMGLTDTPAYNAANAFSTTTIGGGAVANAIYSTNAGTITGTGCAADYMLHMAFSRSNADTSTDTAIAIESLIVDYNGGFD